MMTEIYTLKPGYQLPSRNQATRLTEMRNELIMGEDKMNACMTGYLTKLLILLVLLWTHADKVKRIMLIPRDLERTCIYLATDQ